MNRKRWPFKFRLPVLLTCLLAWCAPDQAETGPFDSGQVTLFGNWAVGCSNLRTCTAIVPLSQSSILEPPYYLEMRYSGLFSDRDGFAVMREGKPLVTLSADVADKLLRDLRQKDGAELVHLTDQDRHFDVPRSGFADMMTALEAWHTSPTSGSAIPDVVTPLPAARIDNLLPPLKIKGAVKGCPKASMGRSLQAWRGIGGQILWQVGCGNEGLNSSSFWYVAGPQGSPPTEIEFHDTYGPATLYNSWFQSETGYLRSTHYFGRWDRYDEDCGIYRTYAWGMEGMKLVEQRYMPQCGTGIGPEGWPVVYQATVLNGPDSGP